MDNAYRHTCSLHYTLNRPNRPNDTLCVHWTRRTTLLHYTYMHAYICRRFVSHVCRSRSKQANCRAATLWRHIMINWLLGAVLATTSPSSSAFGVAFSRWKWINTFIILTSDERVRVPKYANVQGFHLMAWCVYLTFLRVLYAIQMGAVEQRESLSGRVHHNVYVYT